MPTQTQGSFRFWDTDDQARALMGVAFFAKCRVRHCIGLPAYSRRILRVRPVYAHGRASNLRFLCVSISMKWKTRQLSGVEPCRPSLQNDPGDTPHIADAPAGPFHEDRGHGERHASQHAAQPAEASAPGPSQLASQPGPLQELPGPRLSTGKPLSTCILITTSRNS